MNVIKFENIQRVAPVPKSDDAHVVVVDFPIRGIGARLLDPVAAADMIATMKASPRATAVERAQAFRRARSRWIIHTEKIRADLSKRGLPPTAINGVIKRYTAEVREIIATRRVKLDIMPDLPGGTHGR